MTIHNQPTQRKERVYDKGKNQNEQSSSPSIIHRSDCFIKPGKQEPSFPTSSTTNTTTTKPIKIPTNAKTERLSASTQITAQDPVVLQPVLAPVPIAGLTPWQQASQVSMHNLQQQLSNNTHHVGVLVEHLINTGNNNNNNRIDDDNKDNSNSLQQHHRRELNKYFSKQRVDMEMEFKVRRKLPVKTDAEDGKGQVQVLEWFQDTMDFIDKNDSLRYDLPVLIRIISEKGMQPEMLRKFNQVRRDFGEFPSWDDFATWIFRVHKLNGKCIICLKEKFAAIKLKSTAPPDELLKPFKEWEDLIIIALKANPDLEKYFHDTEQDLVGRAFGKIPKSYMDFIKPIQYQHNGFEPDDWIGLQTLIDAAAEEKQRQGDRDFDPFKSKSKGRNSNDALIGTRVNLAQRTRRGSRRKFQRGYRNQGNRKRYDRFFNNNKNNKRGNKYDNKRNQANRSGRGGNTSEYRGRGRAQAPRSRGRGRSKTRGRGSYTTSTRARGRGRGQQQQRSSRQSTPSITTKDIMQLAYRNDDCFGCKLAGHWKSMCNKLTKKQKQALQKRAMRERRQVNITTTTAKSKADKQATKPKKEPQPSKPSIAIPSPTFRTDQKPHINVARQPLHLHINSSTDPQQVSRVLAGLTNPRNNPTN